MIIGSMHVTFYAPWVRSLKEKRMVVRSLISRCQNKFSVSAAEVEQMDVHQTIVLGIAIVSNDAQLAQTSLQKALNYMETLTDAELVNHEIHIFYNSDQYQ